MKKGMVAVISAVLGAIAGSVGQGYIKNKQIDERNKKVDKFKSYYNMLNQWLVIKQGGKSLAEYFIDNDIKTIAIYGMGEMGNRLLDELKDSEVEVKYGIDKQADYTYADIDVVSPDEELDDVDAVVITAIFAFDEISEELGRNVSCPIISLEDVVYEL
jgi:hypothetical protein